MGFGRGGRMMMGEFSLEMLTGGGTGRQQAGRQSQAGESSRFMMPDRKPATTVATADSDYFKAVSDKYIELTASASLSTFASPRGPSSSTVTFSSASLLSRRPASA